jgi:hypothetical protein
MNSAQNPSRQLYIKYLLERYYWLRDKTAPEVKGESQEMDLIWAHLVMGSRTLSEERFYCELRKRGLEEQEAA